MWMAVMAVTLEMAVTALMTAMVMTAESNTMPHQRAPPFPQNYSSGRIWRHSLE